MAVPFLKRSFEAFWQGRRKFKKKGAHCRLSRGGREGTKKFRKSSSSGQKFFLPMARAVKKYARYYLLPAHTNNTHAEERERERERERLYFFRTKDERDTERFKSILPGGERRGGERPRLSRRRRRGRRGTRRTRRTRTRRLGRKRRRTRRVRRFFFLSRYLFLNGDDDDDDDD